ncbi:hypothetical protein D9M70_523620 [compost metagenome]
MSRGTLLFNAGLVDVGVGPGVQFLSIEADALHPDTEFPDVGANSFVELGAAHAEVGWCRIGPKYSGHASDQAGRALLGCCGHGCPSPRCPVPHANAGCCLLGKQRGGERRGGFGTRGTLG